MTKKSKIPQFNSYACIGDCVRWESEGFELVATLRYDDNTSVHDYDCYSPLKIKQWENDQWFFVGVEIHVVKNGIVLSDSAASLWGVECNYNKKANRYLSEVVAELEGEALIVAKIRLAEIIQTLTKD